MIWKRWESKSYSGSGRGKIEGKGPDVAKSLLWLRNTKETRRARAKEERDRVVGNEVTNRNERLHNIIKAIARILGLY